MSILVSDPVPPTHVLVVSQVPALNRCPLPRSLGSQQSDSSHLQHICSAATDLVIYIYTSSTCLKCLPDSRDHQR